MNKIWYEDKFAVHPGYYLMDNQDALELTLEEFAEQLKMEPCELLQLQQGDIPVTDEIAQKISDFFGNSKVMWLRLQNKFDIVKNEIEREKDLLSLVEEEVEQNTKIG